jgi:hypothetical protein
LTRDTVQRVLQQGGSLLAASVARASSSDAGGLPGSQGAGDQLDARLDESNGELRRIEDGAVVLQLFGVDDAQRQLVGFQDFDGAGDLHVHLLRIATGARPRHIWSWCRRAGSASSTCTERRVENSR